MKWTLQRPLAFFDLETTGTDIMRDRIIEIGIVRWNPDGTEEERRYLLNPERPIPKESTAIHGISDADVADQPTFAEKAREIHAELDPCDLGGFHSNRFDVPVLLEEFLRLDMVFNLDGRALIDARNIFVLKEKRDLASAYAFYCGKDLENAHSALADVRATAEVFRAQLEHYGDLGETPAEVHAFCNQQYLNHFDAAGRMVVRKGVPVFNFGKYRNRPVVDVLRENPSYYDWIQRSDFPRHTKQKLKEVKLTHQL